MDDLLPSYDKAVHSDFLIHWTGKDFEGAYPPAWYVQDHRSKTDSRVSELYAKRLKDIISYGLWMTEEGEKVFQVGTKEIVIPSTPQCCFTELKLSESRRHAARYGRLGIGVKRPFLFQRFGRPLAYFGFGETTRNDKFLEACAEDLRDRRLMRFFKPMNTKVSKLTYDLYSESEWRILYFKELLESGKILDPRDSKNEREHEYFLSLSEEEREKLKYLIPLDGWFAVIIYPSLEVKNLSQWVEDYQILDGIRRIKQRDDRGNRVEGLKRPVRGNWPIELHLDSCRHF